MNSARASDVGAAALRCLGFSLVVSAKDADEKECRLLLQRHSDDTDLSNKLVVAEGKMHGGRALMCLWCG